MFTGIITDIGELISLDKQGDWQLRIKTHWNTKILTLVHQLLARAYALRYWTEKVITLMCQLQWKQFLLPLYKLGSLEKNQFGKSIKSR